MEYPLIAAGFAGILIILQQILMITTGFQRVSSSIGVGVGEDDVLLRKTRRHGNLAENSAILIFLVTFIELSGAPYNVVVGFAVLFLISRIAHAIGLSYNSGAVARNFTGATLCRVIGAFTTGFGGLAGAGYLLFRVYGMM